MTTALFDLNKDEDLQEVCKLLKNRMIVSFPTETVYGLGANALDPQSIRKVYDAKGRPSDNPLIVHIGRFEQINDLVRETSSPEYKLSIQIARRFWPGPLSLVFPKSSIVPDEITGGLKTVVLRMPSHPIARKLLMSLGSFSPRSLFM